MSAPSRIPGLDAFRGLAAILVFGFHFWSFFLRDWGIPTEGFSYLHILSAGHLGLNLFFVLSGFLILLSFYRSKTVSTYFLRRIRRIVPLAYFVLLASFVLLGNFETPFWKDLGMHFTFLQSLFSDYYHGQFPVFWTLSLEMLFYLFVPLFCYLVQRKPWRFWSLLLLMVGLNFWYRSHVWFSFEGMSPFDKLFITEQLWGRFDQFALGMALGWLHLQGKLKLRHRGMGLCLLVGGVGIVLLMLQHFAVVSSGFRDLWHQQVFWHSFAGLGFFLWLWGFCSIKGKLRSWASPRWLEGIGVLSYSIYLLHFPILSFFHQQQSSWEVALGGTIGLTLLGSLITYHLIEKPFLRHRSSPPMKLIVGLGNYPEKYHQTRHNAGFLAIDALVGEDVVWKSQFQGKTTTIMRNGEKVLLLKPHTYMNASGRSVRAAMDYYKIAPENLLVLSDDVDLPFGTVRFREKGSDGGQKGLRDIFKAAGTTDIARIKFGISNPHRDHTPTEDFVLSAFSKEEKEQLPEVWTKGLEEIQAWIMKDQDPCPPAQRDQSKTQGSKSKAQPTNPD